MKTTLVDISTLINRAIFLNKLQASDQNLFDWINLSLPKDHLTKVLVNYESNTHFGPVNLLRLLIGKEIERKTKIDGSKIEELKKSIESRTIAEYFNLNDEVKLKLKKYKESNKGMFPNWKNPFSILLPFIYTGTDKETDGLLLYKIGDAIIEEFDLSDVQKHKVGFEGSQNYGSDRAWGAIIPVKAQNVQQAYQIFFTITAKGITGGIHCGHKIKNKTIEDISETYTDFESYKKGISSLIPKWKELNASLNFDINKDVTDFKARVSKSEPEALNTYFNILDKLIEDLKIENKTNLVFSTRTNHFSFQVGKRYCLNLKNDKFLFIAPENYELNNIEKDRFAEPDVALLYKNVNSLELVKHYDAFLKAVQFEIQRDNHTDEKEYDNKVFRRAVFDKEYRATFFDFKPLINPSNNTIITKIFSSKDPNQILFGPPGTGKTYFLNKFMNVAEEKETADTNIVLKNNVNFWHLAPGRNGYLWDSLKDTNVLGYEWCENDFGDLNDYETSRSIITRFSKVKEGDYFCIISGKKLYGIAEALSDYNFDTSKNNNFDFQTIQIKWIKQFKPALLLELSSTPSFTKLNGSKRWSNLINILTLNGIKIEDENIKIEPKKNHTFVTFHQSMTYEDFVEGIKPKLDDDENENTENGQIEYQNRDGIFKEACDIACNYAGFEDLADALAVTKDERTAKFKNAPPFYLLIDEINRGNVSAILGELITLIEDTKRLGSDDEKIVQLPYSLKQFGVPPNLFIIGTMNTADRSVEALDTALRRRFSFIEKAPKPKLIRSEGKVKDGKIDDIDLVKLLKLMNKRIEKLLDKDHMIGHSYFLSIENLNDLKGVFQNKIIPLLQEYFYGDFGKIGLVIGKDFFKEVKQESDDNFFASFDDYDTSALLEKKVYHLYNVSKMEDVDFKKALKTMLNN